MLGPQQARIRSFDVTPSLPKPLERLRAVAYNLWWTWHPDSIELWLRLGRQLWADCHHNPVKLLGSCPQMVLEEMARDEGYQTLLDRVYNDMRRHMERTPWLERAGKDPGKFTIAYFCAEYGLTECLPIYSGGLGCLAGDHLKSASELGIPLVAVGLMYRHGYFQQYLNADGWQQEYYPDLDFFNLPVTLVRDAKGQPLRVSVSLPGREVQIGIWQATVGRIPLYLLDTNLPENDPMDRGITGQLYGGDMEMRIKQELVLGIGGVRALLAMGIDPDVCHMNEGHSAFLSLERIRNLIAQYDLAFDEARQAASASHVFTTHTPVPAGIDRFPPEMIQRYFKNYHENLRLDIEGLLALGRENVFNKNEYFSMAVLAIRTSDWANAVSRLHGQTSRNMWHGIWPGVPTEEIPITHVTNGVHARSWLSGDLTYLLDRHLGNRWQNNPVDQTVWQEIYEIPDEELWRVHERRRHRLVIWARRQRRRQLESQGASAAEIEAAGEVLNPQALTIGFARRFATYKRANLLLRDPERLRRLLANNERPVQIVIAGKAHPADGAGKDLIRQIIRFAREAGVEHRLVFLENYDIAVARYLVQGCDVWLNTPRRGMEASGTSGMKAAINGVLNCSVLDGWWDEAYQNGIGWAIGRGETYANLDLQDDIESRALYDLLEKQIVPLFYQRDEQGIPRGWLDMMKRCIATLAPVFNTNRMVQEYTERLYLPALKRSRKLRADRLAKSVELCHQKYRLRQHWPRLRIEEVQARVDRPLGVHEKLPISVVAYLGEPKPEELRVQVFFGLEDNDGRIVNGRALDLQHEKDLGGGRHRFVGELVPLTSGRHGFAVRIIPGGDLFDGICEPGLIYWDSLNPPG